MTDQTQKPLPRHIRGKRPKFFEDPASDHLLSMVLELSAELWVSRSRQAALESYLVQAGQLDAKAFETHALSEAEEADLSAWRAEFMRRLMRTIEAEAKTG
ncbi:MAG: hypothetical protein AAF221_13435 [Pseudomonadota bacterium]